MRTPFLLISFILFGLNLISQINQIPGIVIQNDFDYDEGSKPIYSFYNDYVLIHCNKDKNKEAQLWLTNGNESETQLLLETTKSENIIHIETMGRIAFVFVQSTRDSIVNIYRIENNFLNLDTNKKSKNWLLDFKVVRNRIHFTEINLTSLPQFSYYYYDTNTKEINQIFKNGGVALSTPISWKNELYYIGSVSGIRGTSLIKYIPEFDTLEVVSALDTGYTYLESTATIQDENLMYLFTGFINTQHNEVHHFLIRSDGTATGTYKLKEIRGPLRGHENESIIWNDKLYFGGNDPHDIIGEELYVSDGTITGTYLLKDLQPGMESFFPGNFIEYDQKLAFNSSLNAGFYTLRLTNGTTIGTKSFESEFRYNLGPIINMDDTLILCGSNDFVTSVGNEIFFYTKDGNLRYFDISPGNDNTGHSRLYQSILTPHKVFFVINDNSGFIHPYVYHRGTLVKNSDVGSIDDELLLYPNPVKDHLYFNTKINPNEISKITVVAENGIEIGIEDWADHKINTKSLLPGLYKIIFYQKDKLIYSGSFSKVK